VCAHAHKVAWVRDSDAPSQAREGQRPAMRHDDGPTKPLAIFSMILAKQVLRLELPGTAGLSGDKNTAARPNRASRRRRRGNSRDLPCDSDAAAPAGCRPPRAQAAGSGTAATPPTMRPRARAVQLGDLLGRQHRQTRCRLCARYNAPRIVTSAS